MVYMVGLEEGLFPGQSAVDSYDDEEVEEERRLAYVGITRAKDLLTITSAASRMLRGEMFYKPISRFVREIPEELWDEAPPKEMERGSYDRYEEPAFFNSYGRRRFDDAPPWETGGYDAPRYAAGGRPNRLKATYVKPHTAEEKKPFIAQSLSQMKKGLPDGAGEKPDYAVGDRVRHIKHGDGTVLAMEETPRDTKVTVLFDEAGQKIMYAAFARLQKL